MSWVRREEWPWWQAGLLLGLLSMFAFYTANYYLSASTTFSRAAGMLVGTVAPMASVEAFSSRSADGSFSAR